MTVKHGNVNNFKVMSTKNVCFKVMSTKNVFCLRFSPVAREWSYYDI
jgi:hypothetical protein